MSLKTAQIEKHQFAYFDQDKVAIVYYIGDKGK